jgi:hypothetical protein
MAIGKQIYTVEQLNQAALARRSVIAKHGSWLATKPSPAAVIMSMQARLVLRLLENGLFIYEKPDPDRPKFFGGGLK